MRNEDAATVADGGTTGKQWSLGRLTLWVFVTYYLLFLFTNGTIGASADLAMLATKGVATSGYVYEIDSPHRRRFTGPRHVATISFTDQSSTQRMARVRMTSGDASSLKRGMAIDVLYVPGNEKVAALSLSQATHAVVAGLLGPLIFPLVILVVVVFKTWRKSDEE